MERTNTINLNRVFTTKVKKWKRNFLWKFLFFINLNLIKESFSKMEIFSDPNTLFPFQGKTCKKKKIDSDYTILFKLLFLSFKGSSRWRWILFRRFLLRSTMQSIRDQTMQQFLHLLPSDRICSSTSSLRSLLPSRKSHSVWECCYKKKVEAY